MTDAAFARNRDNFCYRHPDRQSFVLCQRCGRTVCPECQTQGPVGVLCPECMKEQKAQRSPAQRKAERRWGRSGQTVALRSGFRALPVTYVTVAITVFVSLLQMIPGGFGQQVTQLFGFVGLAIDPEFGANMQPWRAFTVALVHGGFLHLLLNMLSLWMVGRVLEPLLGWARFLALYLISAFAGSVLMAIIDPGQSVVGASGAIFGIFGALFVITRSLGGNVVPLLAVLGINFVYGFIATGIAWQAHLGGLIGGLAVGAIYAATRKPAQRGLQIVLLVGLVVLLALATFLIPVFHPLRG